MALDSGIMFESMGVVNPTIPEVRWQKSSGSPQAQHRDNMRHAHLVGLAVR